MDALYRQHGQRIRSSTVGGFLRGLGYQTDNQVPRGSENAPSGSCIICISIPLAAAFAAVYSVHPRCITYFAMACVEVGESGQNADFVRR